MGELSGNYYARSLLLQINKFLSANCVHLIGFSTHGIAHRRNTSLKICSIILMQLSFSLPLNHLDPSRINKQYVYSLVGRELQKNSKVLGIFPYSRSLNNLGDVTSRPYVSATVLTATQIINYLAES